jgi:hypothetical protein
MERNPIKELRWLVAETLIGWALSIAPDDQERTELARALQPWMKRHLQEMRRVMGNQ